MSTAIEICNLALASLGDEAMVTSLALPYQSAQAMYCAQFYPIALNDVLDCHNWAFNKKTAVMIATSNTDSRWLYCYTLPVDFNRVVEIYDASAANYLVTNREKWAFEISTNNAGVLVLYTNLSGAELEYQGLLTDPTKLSIAARNCVVWMLSSYLAGPMLKGDVGVKAKIDLMNAFPSVLAKAIDGELSNRRVSSNFIPSGIAARNG